MDRRSFMGVLAGAGLIGLSGCTDSRPRPHPTWSGSATPLPSDDDLLRDATFAAEQELVTRYAVALATAGPELAEQLRTLQAQHVEHAHRLRPERAVATAAPTHGTSPTSTPVSTPTAAPSTTAEEPDAGTGSATPDPGSSAAPPATTSASPPAPGTVLADLRRAERAALEQRREACQQADVLAQWRAELAR